MEQERDFTQEAAQFRQEHPQVEELSDQVTERWAQGSSLNEAWEETEAEREPETFAAVEPVTGQGGAEQPRRDDFLTGLETEAW